jgi:hypothetical protein
VKHHRVARRGAFIMSVAAISILANFGVELAAEKWPQLGLVRFTAFTHKG